MEIRKAQQKDLKAINDIYNQAVDTRYSTADITPISLKSRKIWFIEHQPKNYPVFVAEINNKVLGWLSFSPYRKGRMALSSTAEISYYIHKDFRRKGIGNALLNFAIKKASKYNFKNLLALLLEHNKGSIRLLEKSGFKKWGLMPRLAEIDGEEYGHLYYGLRLKK